MLKKIDPLPLIALVASLVPGVTGCGKVEARALAKQGNTLYREGKLTDALAKFERAVSIDPEFALAHLHSGYACMGLLSEARREDAQRYARLAKQAFGRFIELQPGDERGPKFLLQVLVDAGQYAEALAFLEQQHKANPRDVQVVASLGLVSSKAGRFAEALRWYEKRAELLPREAQARYLIGTLCWEHLYGNKAVSAADRARFANRGIAALERAVQLRPGYIEAVTYINLLYRERALAHGDARARERDLKRADEYHKQALRLLRDKTNKEERKKQRQEKQQQKKK